MVALLILACVTPPDSRSGDTAPPDDTAVDSGGDTAGDTDTAADTDTAEDTDPDDTATEPLLGALHVEGTWRGAPFVVDCTQADPGTVFVRYWSDAVGNVAGTLGCYRPEDPRPFAAVTFSTGATGEWAEPENATWMVGDQGASWTHGAGGSTAWSLAITRFERVDLDTYALAGTLSGAWTAEDGGGSVTGTFDALLPCSGACP